MGTTVGLRSSGACVCFLSCPPPTQSSSAPSDATPLANVGKALVDLLTAIGGMPQTKDQVALVGQRLV